MFYGENCACGGNSIDRFYALFTCDRANCNECKWTNNNCCIGSYINKETDIGDCTNGCINYYNIPMHDVIVSKIKSFGFCKTNEVTDDEGNTAIYGALAVQFTNGAKKLFMNVNKELYDNMIADNKDFKYINLEQSLCNSENQCIDIL